MLAPQYIKNAQCTADYDLFIQPKNLHVLIHKYSEIWLHVTKSEKKQYKHYDDVVLNNSANTTQSKDQ